MGAGAATCPSAASAKARVYGSRLEHFVSDGCRFVFSQVDLGDLRRNRGRDTIIYAPHNIHDARAHFKNLDNRRCRSGSTSATRAHFEKAKALYEMIGDARNAQDAARELREL